MHSAGDDDGFLLSMIFQVLLKPVSKSCKVRACGQEMILVILKEAFDLFFKCCLKQPLDPAFGVVALSGKLLCLLILLSKCFLDHVGNLMHDPHLFIIIKICADIICDRQQWHR